MLTLCYQVITLVMGFEHTPMLFNTGLNVCFGISDADELAVPRPTPHSGFEAEDRYQQAVNSRIRWKVSRCVGILLCLLVPTVLLAVVGVYLIPDTSGVYSASNNPLKAEVIGTSVIGNPENPNTRLRVSLS